MLLPATVTWPVAARFAHLLLQAALSRLNFASALQLQGDPQRVGRLSSRLL